MEDTVSVHRGKPPQTSAFYENEPFTNWSMELEDREPKEHRDHSDEIHSSASTEALSTTRSCASLASTVNTPVCYPQAASPPACLSLYLHPTQPGQSTSSPGIIASRQNTTAHLLSKHYLAHEYPEDHVRAWREAPKDAPAAHDEREQQVEQQHAASNKRSPISLSSTDCTQADAGKKQAAKRARGACDAQAESVAKGEQCEAGGHVLEAGGGGPAAGATTLAAAAKPEGAARKEMPFQYPPLGMMASAMAKAVAAKKGLSNASKAASKKAKSNAVLGARKL